jgi:hypothetical protein
MFLPAVLALDACKGCKGCKEDEPTEDGGVTITAKIEFVRPANNDSLTAADDADDDTAGFQADVLVRSLDLPDGTVAKLTVDTAPGTELTASLSGHDARFTPTLLAGPFPDGQLHTLTVSAEGAEGQSITVRVIENTAAKCQFMEPEDGATLTDDESAGTSGFQTGVVVSCSGIDVTPAGPVRLEIHEGSAASGVPANTLSQSLSNGQAAFAAVTLPEGDATLQASVLGTAGTQVGVASITVTVDTNRCDARIALPTAQSVLTKANSTDLVAGTSELDLDFVVTSSLCPTGTVTLSVGTGPSVTGTLAAGAALIRVALPQGSVQVVASVDDGNGPLDPGQSLPVSYTVDTLAPCPTLTTPAADAVLTATDDEETPPTLSNGVSHTLRGSVENPEGSSAVSVTVLRDTVTFATQSTSISNGQFSLLVEDMPAGAYTVRLSATDQNGNTCPAAGEPARESSFSVTLGTPTVTLSVCSDDLVEDGNLTADEDDSTDTGYQVAGCVLLTNDSADTATVTVRFTPVDQDGNQTDTPIEVSGALADDGSARLVATLADALYRVSAVVSFSDGRTSISPATTQTVLVDATLPDLTIRAPEDLAVLGTNVVDVEVVSAATDLDPSSVALTVNGSAQGTPVSLGGGVYGFASVVLAGSQDGVYVLVATAEDVVGNRESATVTVSVDDTVPVPALTGVDQNGAARTLSVDPGAPTAVETLDYDNNAANGTQYGFAIEVSLADCTSMGPSPAAVLDISGIADQVVVPLTESGAVCRGVANNGGAGYTLQDGSGQAVATVADLAGNAGQAAVFFAVNRAGGFVRIDSPEAGARIGAAAINVSASSSVSGSGTCSLLVNNGAAGTSVTLAASMSFSSITINGNDGDNVALKVQCTVDGNTVESLPVTVIKDALGPTNGELVLADGSALPAVFNVSVTADAGLATNRYLKHLGVDVDAEGGSCSRLGAAPQLSATPEGGQATVYDAEVSGGLVWQFISTSNQCRAVFNNVDLGARTEAGLTTALEASLQDTAGNASTVSASRLNDQVAPVLTRTAPQQVLLGALDDAHTGVTGFQAIVEYDFTSDTRAATVATTCSGTSASCSGAVQSVSRTATHVVLGSDAGDPLTLASGEGRATVTTTLTDAAGNATEDSVLLTVDLTAPTVSITSPTGATLLAADDDDGNGTTPGYLTDVVVTTNAAEGQPCTLADENAGSTIDPSTANTNGTTATFTGVRLAEGARRVVAACTDGAGNVGTSTAYEPTVDTLAPVLSVAPNTGTYGTVNDADTSTDGIQVVFTVTHSGLETGQELLFDSNLENPTTGTNSAEADGTTDVTVTFVVAGTHTVTLTAADGSGNPTSSAFNIEIQSGTWTVTVTNPTQASALLGGDDDADQDPSNGLQTTIAFTTNAPASSTATLSIDGVAQSPTVSTSTITDGSQGSFSVTLAHSTTPYSYSVHVSSVATEGQSATQDITVDLSGPTVTITKPGTILRYNRLGDDTHTSDSSGDLGLQADLEAQITGCGTASSPGTLVVTLGTSTLVSTSITADGLHVLTAVTLPEGDNQTLRFTCTDNAGNSLSDSKVITVDSTAPGSPALSAALSGTRRGGDINVTFTAPGDDGDTGALQDGAYEVVYLLGEQVSSTNFSQGTAVTAPNPGNPGDSETVSAQNLGAEQVVFFGLRVTDNDGNQTVVGTTTGIDLSLEERNVSVSGRSGVNFAFEMSKQAGDVNGDGLQDFVIGLNTANPDGVSASATGEVWVVYGSASTGVATSITELTSFPASARCGLRVHIIKSINGDALDEVLVSCLSTHTNTYLWYGVGGTGITDGATADVTITDTFPASGSLGFGRGAASADFDGDGNRDLVIGASMGSAQTEPPRVYVVYGDGTATRFGSGGSTLNLGTELAALRATLFTCTDKTEFGFAIGVLRHKVNGARTEGLGIDGAAGEELVVGADLTDGILADQGAIYVIHGSGAVDGQSISVNSPTTVVVEERVGSFDAASAYMGQSIAVGDLNGDGFDDLVGGANGNATGSVPAGARAYLTENGGTAAAAPSTTAIQVRPDGVMVAGQALGLGDFNADGFDDLLFGGNDKAFVVLGSAGFTTVSTPAYSFDLDSTTKVSAAAGSDVNADGFPDIILGSINDPGTVVVRY